MVPMSLLSAALDEIYLLRAAMAVEHGVIGEVLEYRTLPLGVHRLLLQARVRTQACAQGKAQDTYVQWGISGLKTALSAARARQTLTRTQFEAEVAGRTTA
jgi:hypothetical protein